VDQTFRTYDPAYGSSTVHGLSTVKWAAGPKPGKSIRNTAMMIFQNLNGTNPLYEIMKSGDKYLIVQRDINPICFTNEGLDYFKALIKKFDNNSWGSAREIKDLILGNKGDFVRTNVLTGPYAGCSIHCHCVTYTKEHVCEDCLCIQLMKKGIKIPDNMLTFKANKKDGVAPKGRPSEVTTRFDKGSDSSDSDEDGVVEEYPSRSRPRRQNDQKAAAIEKQKQAIIAQQK
jgi:hypothetical protein